MPDLQSRSSVRNSTRRPPAGGVKRSRGAGTADAALVPRNTAMTPARILIVDDDADFRWLLLTLLEADSRVRVAGEAGDGEAAVDLVRQAGPSIVLMDLVMPRSDGLEATRRIKQAAPGTKVVVLSVLPDEPYRRMAQDSGADEFLNKRDTVTALLPTIKLLSGGAAGAV
jgi:DNA-binding NarL/FixJ family response regulator